MLSCAAVTTALLVGCGSSSKSTSSSETTPTATSTAAAKTPSRYGAGGASSTSSTSSTTPAASTAAAVTITTKHAKPGTILAAGPKHMTVYLFEGDKGGQSACTGACAAAWPPLTTSGTPQASGSAQSSHLGTITRTDGTKQVTYNGHPLYFFSKDGDAGDAYGQGVKAFGADWYVVAPSGAKIDSDESHGSGGGSAS
jgi:predicted lipoprotein with Yx(FWY)xxD motif